MMPLFIGAGVNFSFDGLPICITEAGKVSMVTLRLLLGLPAAETEAPEAAAPAPEIAGVD